jgi:hypothetical protein
VKVLLGLVSEPQDLAGAGRQTCGESQCCYIKLFGVCSIPGLAYLPVAEALHSSFHCWALDQRGHGCSAHAALLPVRLPSAQFPADAAHTADGGADF